MLATTHRKLHELELLDAVDAVLVATDLGVLGSYRHFTVPKKNGKKRNISAPHPTLKTAQKAIDRALTGLDDLRTSEVGFRKEHTYTDAAGYLATKVDLSQAWILTWDLDDFFGSIKTKRVQRTLRRLGEWNDRTFKYVLRAATHEGKLAQGSPCSPRLASAAIANLDKQIDHMVKKLGGAYVRYADDLTVALPADTQRETAQWVLGRVKTLARGQGVKVNERKVHCSTKRKRCVEIVGAHLQRHSQTLREARAKKRLRQWFNHLAKKLPADAKTSQGNAVSAVAAGFRANKTLLSKAHLRWSRMGGYLPPTRCGPGIYLNPQAANQASKSLPYHHVSGMSGCK